jgi:hypothetical protein
LEADAVVVHNYQLAHVPGLLQTEDYMRTLFRNSRRRPSDAEIDRDVEARLRRQRRLTEEPALESGGGDVPDAVGTPLGGPAAIRRVGDDRVGPHSPIGEGNSVIRPSGVIRPTWPGLRRSRRTR